MRIRDRGKFIPGRPGQAIETGDHQHITVAQMRDKARQLLAVGLRPADLFLVDFGAAGGLQLGNLCRQRLPVCRYPPVTQVRHFRLRHAVRASIGGRGIGDIWIELRLLHGRSRNRCRGCQIPIGAFGLRTECEKQVYSAFRICKLSTRTAHPETMTKKSKAPQLAACFTPSQTLRYRLLAPLRHADWIGQCPPSGVTRKTFVHTEFFSV